MMERVRNWLEAVMLVSMLLAVARSLLPEGSVRRIAGYTGGLVLLAVLLRPLARGEDGAFRLTLARYTAAVEDRQTELAGAEAQALAQGIAERTQAYILDKAAALGTELSAVTVTTRTGGDGVPLPWGAELTGPYSRTLAEELEQELGISKERQVWHER